MFPVAIINTPAKAGICEQYGKIQEGMYICIGPVFLQK